MIKELTNRYLAENLKGPILHPDPPVSALDHDKDGVVCLHIYFYCFRAESDGVKYFFVLSLIFCSQLTSTMTHVSLLVCPRRKADFPPQQTHATTLAP